MWPRPCGRGICTIRLRRLDLQRLAALRRGGCGSLRQQRTFEVSRWLTFDLQTVVIGKR